MRSVAIEVFGKVQGVWFRGSTAQKAKSLGIVGFVCNRTDGSVYIEAHGNQGAVQSLINWCKIGPAHASVENINVSEIPPTTASNFVVKRW